MNFFNIFSKNLKQLFLDFNPKNSTWRVVKWNLDTNLTLLRQYTVEVIGDKSHLIQWDFKKDPIANFFENQKLVKRQKIKKDLKIFQDLMNISVHSTIEYSLDLYKDFMFKPVVGATSLDIQNEAKAIQWIQVSFGTLVRSLEKLKNNRDLIFTGAFFSGVVPDTKENVLRVIAFNLDIFYYFRDDFSLQVVIFDDKYHEHGTIKNPSFHQIIKVTKPQFYDEIIKLLNEFAKAGEII
jgi:hypothetical protein